MRAKQLLVAAVLGLCCSWGQARAQSPYLPEQRGGGVTETPLPPPKAPAAETVHQGETGLSSWITYDRPCCQGHGGGMPILTEILMRIGLAVPVGGERMGHLLDTGWMIEGAGRAMFFNRSWSRAIAVELGISNHFNSSSDDTTIISLKNSKLDVTLRSYNRTFVHLGVGPEFYPWAPANSTGARLRVGADVGGRYGAAVAQFNEIRHRTDVIGGFYGALHSDLELPYGRCTFIGGVRTEYGYTWSDIFEGTADMQDINVLFNFGVRY